MKQQDNCSCSKGKATTKDLNIHVEEEISSNELQKTIVKVINDLKEETQKLVFDLKEDMINTLMSSKRIQTNR
jgi:phenylalanyl-tRNA synthetase beta subunit